MRVLVSIDLFWFLDWGRHLNARGKPYDKLISSSTSTFLASTRWPTIFFGQNQMVRA